MDVPGFYELKAHLEARFAQYLSSEKSAWMAIRDVDITAAMTGVLSMPSLLFKDTICRQVSSRNQKLHDFSLANDVVIFVAGKKSSNGQVLYHICKEANPRSYFIEEIEEIEERWLRHSDGRAVATVGVCGATSTPMWHLEKVALHLEKNFAQ
jgi:4-hydroxy-3-methylbut-2-enyl diphosphate reductase